MKKQVKNTITLKAKEVEEILIAALKLGPDAKADFKLAERGDAYDRYSYKVFDGVEISTVTEIDY